jgi:hypothetical protein
MESATSSAQAIFRGAPEGRRPLRFLARDRDPGLKSASAVPALVLARGSSRYSKSRIMRNDYRLHVLTNSPSESFGARGTINLSILSFRDSLMSEAR